MCLCLRGVSPYQFGPVSLLLLPPSQPLAREEPLPPVVCVWPVGGGGCGDAGEVLYVAAPTGPEGEPSPVAETERE